MSNKSFPDPDAIIIGDNPKVIKILSWNLWWKFENYLERQELIFSELLELQPDILCLQEVWAEKDESQAEKIASLLNYNYIYGKSFEIDEVGFGNAVISRYPINEHTIHYMPTKPDFDEKRLLLHAKIKYNDLDLNVMCTHLNYKYEHQNIREDQVQFILEYISKLKKTKFPIILCGDFNADPNSDEIRLITGHRKPINQTVLRDAWVITNPYDQGFTWSNKNTYAKKTLEFDRRIDYIFVGRAGKNGIGQPIKSVLVGNNEKNNIFPSDHFGIITHLVG